MNKMNTYHIKNEFGSVCGDGAQAVAFLQGTVLPSLETGEHIQLDFDGVRVINSSFSNALFGNLFKKKGQEVLQQLTISNVKDSVKSEIKSGITFGLSKHSQSTIS